MFATKFITKGVTVKAGKIINDAIRLPQYLTVYDHKVHEHIIEYYVTAPTPTDVVCPHCGNVNCSSKGSDGYFSVHHVPTGLQGSMINFKRLRYFCNDCNVSFTYRPVWIHKSLPITMDLYQLICTRLSSTSSLKDIAISCGVTRSIVRGVLKSINLSHPDYLGEVFCIDEFKGESGEWQEDDKYFTSNMYHCNIVDWKSHRVIDILPKRDSKYLKKYFMTYSDDVRKNVKYLCCDMHEGFANLCDEIFPNAEVCTDYFHVIKRLLDALDEVRIRYQNELKDAYEKVPHNKHLENKRKALKDSSHLIKTWKEHIPKYYKKDPSKPQKKLRSIFSNFPDLEVVYNAVQEFHVLSTQDIYELKRASLSDWISRYESSEVPELRAAVKTIEDWKDPILNSFKTGYSNGPCEGINNKIKVLKRNCYGFRSFENFRKRILLCCGFGKLMTEEHSIVSERRNTAKKEHDSNKKDQAPADQL